MAGTIPNRKPSSSDQLRKVLLVGSAALLIFFGSPSSAQAGPHHFLTWHDGVIVLVVAPHREITIEETQSHRRQTFLWSHATRVWNHAHPGPKAGEAVHAEALKPGQPVRILARTSGRHLWTERIILSAGEPSVGQAPRRTEAPAPSSRNRS